MMVTGHIITITIIIITSWGVLKLWKVFVEIFSEYYQNILWRFLFATKQFSFQWQLNNLGRKLQWKVQLSPNFEIKQLHSVSIHSYHHHQSFHHNHHHHNHHLASPCPVPHQSLRSSCGPDEKFEVFHDWIIMMIMIIVIMMMMMMMMMMIVMMMTIL